MRPQNTWIKPGRKRGRIFTAVLATATISLLIGVFGSRPSARAATSPAHIMVLMMENQGYSDIIGPQPYETQLAAKYQNDTKAWGLGHYSLDNYLGFLSGNWYSWSDGDCTPGGSCLAPASDQVLTAQLENAGVSWQAFMGGMSSNCASNDQNDYGVRHDPWPYFPSVSSSDCQSHVAPSGNSSNWDSDANLITSLNSSSAPDFVWYSPGLTQDGGGDSGCSASCGDSWLSSELPRIMGTSWYQNGGQILLTYDEGNGGSQGEDLTSSGNQVPSVLISAATGATPTSNSSYVNHWGVLAGIERAYGVPCLGGACNTGSNGLLTFAAGSGGTTTTTTAPASTTTAPPTTAPSTTTTKPPASTTTAPPTTAPSTTTTKPPASTTTAPPTTAPPTTTSPPGSSGSCNQSFLPSGISPAGGSQWCITMHDEFSQDSSLNTQLWEPNWLGSSNAAVTGPVNSNESECYDPAEVSVSAGVLHLKDVASSCSAGGSTYGYRAGMVQTHGSGTTPLFQQAYGAFEARIYLPAQPAGQIANWPAFWTDGQSWPTDGEMDIMEGLSGQACWHFHSSSGGPGSCSSADFTGWHTYGADWEPGKVTYYYDGVAVGTITQGITSAPMYLILNNAVGASGGQTLAPADMQVSYVRVWSQQAGGGVTTSTTQPSSPTTTPASPTTTPTSPSTVPTSQATYTFEDGATDGWSVDYGPASVSNSTAVAHSGSHSLAVSLTGSGNPGVMSPTLSTTGASGWARSSVAISAQPYYYDPSGNYRSLGATVQLPANTWTQVNWPVTASQLGLEIENGSGASGTVYLDDVSTGSGSSGGTTTTTAAPTTTVAPPTTAAPATTVAPPTTAAPTTTVDPPTTPTTVAPTTTTAPPTTVAPSPPAGPSGPGFTFAGGNADGWSLDYGPATVNGSTGKDFGSDGGALAIALTGAGNPGVASPNLQGVTPATSITYRIWAPALMVVEPYASDTTWNYTFHPAVTLQPGWNTVTFTPGGSNVMYVGLEVENGGGATGTLYLDEVSW